MFYITHGTTTSVEGIDIGGIGIILFVHLESKVGFKNIMKEQDLITIYWQTDDSCQVAQCWDYCPKRQAKGICRYVLESEDAIQQAKVGRKLSLEQENYVINPRFLPHFPFSTITLSSHWMYGPKRLGQAVSSEGSYGCGTKKRPKVVHT